MTERLQEHAFTDPPREAATGAGVFVGDMSQQLIETLGDSIGLMIGEAVTVGVSRNLSRLEKRLTRVERLTWAVGALAFGQFLAILVTIAARALELF